MMPSCNTSSPIAWWVLPARSGWPPRVGLGAWCSDPDDHLVGGLPRHLTLQKRELNVFSHPDADRLIELYNRDQPTFVVYGVATDYCVGCAVRGLLDRGCRVAVVVDAVRAIDRSREADVLTEFADGGVLLTLTEVVCGTD